MAIQAFILLAVAASASAQSYASSYNSIADPLQTHSASSPFIPGIQHAQAPSPINYGALSGSPFDAHQLLLQQPGYDVTEAPQEPPSPPSPIAPPTAPVTVGPLPQNPLSFLAQQQPQLPLLPEPQAQLPLLSQHDFPSAPAAPSSLSSHSSTSFSSPYVSYQH